MLRILIFLLMATSPQNRPLAPSLNKRIEAQESCSPTVFDTGTVAITALIKPEKNTHGPFYVDYQLQNDRWRPVLKRLQKSNLIKQ